jgi:hypothetical protein
MPSAWMSCNGNAFCLQKHVWKIDTHYLFIDKSFQIAFCSIATHDFQLLDLIQLKVIHPHAHSHLHRALWHNGDYWKSDTHTRAERADSGAKEKSLCVSRRE